MSRGARPARAWVGARAVRWALLVVAGLVAVPAAAQERAVPPKLEERLLERLRSLDAPRDTAPSPDSAGPAPARPIPDRAAGGPGLPQGPGLPTDSVLEALLSLEGYIATEYRGQEAHYDADSGKVALVGSAEVVRDGQRMTADSLLVYDLRRAIMCGYGEPTLAGGGETAAPVESDQVCYDVDRRVGVALGARTQFTEGATWFVHGDRVYMAGSNRLYSHHARFTDCDLEVPHYHFEAREMKIVRDEVLVARNVTLTFGDVPVFWLPFMMQSVKEGRRSGLLMPRFGVNDIARTSSGYDRRISNVGFFWAINDHMGTQVALDWYSGAWTALEGNFEYRWLRQFLDGGVYFRQYWREEGGTEFSLRTQNSWQPTERTTVRLDADYTSSSDFVRRNSFNPGELNRAIESNAGVSHRMGWGSLSLGARRRQHLSDNRVEMTLPSFSLNLPAVTLFGAPAASARWFNNATWSGTLGFTANTTDVDESLADGFGRDTRTVSADVSSGITLGQLQWSQAVRFNEQVNEAVPPASDTAEALPRTTTQGLTWNTSLNFQQRLIGTSTFTPGLSVEGRMARSPESGNELVTGPTRLDFNASLRTDVFGFFPGVGPFSRIRHKISPSVRYNYSPEVRVDSVQAQVFLASDILERNQISLDLTQTIEAKFREPEGEEGAGSPEAAEAAEGAGSGGDGREEGPRRIEQARKMELLSLTTSALVYDFVKAREDSIGDFPGLQTTDIRHTIRSDLFRGLQLTLGHDLFERGEEGAGPREFSVRLREVNASFSVGSGSWLFRVLGLGGGDDGDRAPGGRARRVEADTLGGAPGEGPEIPDQAGLGILGGSRRGGMRPSFQGGSVGSWNASLSYSLQRPREGSGGRENQSVRANVSFQPTENWSVRWTSSYSITDKEFSDQYLTLSRNLHDWEANFDFVRAQNGNFQLQFRVQLRANPEIKLDYEQRGGDAFTGRTPRFQ